MKKWFKKRQIKKINQKYKSQVLVYSAAWCVACQKTQELLDKYFVTYTVLEIDQSSEAYAELKSLGCLALPVVIFDGVLIEGFKPNRLEQLVLRT